MRKPADVVQCCPAKKPQCFAALGSSNETLDGLIGDAHPIPLPNASEGQYCREEARSGKDEEDRVGLRHVSPVLSGALIDPSEGPGHGDATEGVTRDEQGQQRESEEQPAAAGEPWVTTKNCAHRDLCSRLTPEFCCERSNQ